MALEIYFLLFSCHWSWKVYSHVQNNCWKWKQVVQDFLFHALHYRLILFLSWACSALPGLWMRARDVTLPWSGWGGYNKALFSELFYLLNYRLTHWHSFQRDLTTSVWDEWHWFKFNECVCIAISLDQVRLCVPTLTGAMCNEWFQHVHQWMCHLHFHWVCARGNRFVFIYAHDLQPLEI